jgi:Na+/H+ antiporter NhaD/arsenite permease-like protein
LQGCKKEFHYFCTHGADKPDNGPAGALLKQKRKIRYGMILTMILLFVVGYAFIALEHKVKVDKSAIALLMCGAIWTIFSLWGHDENISHDMVDHLGDTCEILVFLIGAMTIVDLIDSHGGFNVITDHIKTRNKHKLMWLLAFITFFMSAALDNMTTTIIMVMLLRRIIADQKERWIYASLIVIAANSGGAWSPIGDVTTIMLWMRGNVTSTALMGVSSRSSSRRRSPSGISATRTRHRWTRARSKRNCPRAWARA